MCWCIAGTFDVAGFVKERGWWHRIWLGNPSTPEAYMFPHWNWQSIGAALEPHLAKCAGLCVSTSPGRPPNVTVFVLASTGSVELFLNNASLGRQTIKFGAWTTWRVPYAPGRLVAHAFSNSSSGQGKPTATVTVATTGPPAALRASFDGSEGASGIVAGGTGVALVRIEVVDSQGRVVPTAANDVTFSCASGPCAVVGTANGDPSSHTPDRSARRNAFRGLVLAVVQSTSDGRHGPATIAASAPGLGTSTIVVEVIPQSASAMLMRL